MLNIWIPLTTQTLSNQGLSDCSIINNGTTINSQGKIGSCYSFDGNDDFISIDCPDLYRTFSGGSQPFSIAFWIYHADSTRGVIFGDYGLPGGINFNIELTVNHHIRYYWAGNPDKTFVNTDLEINVWTHIVLTYDGNKICMYKNGLLQADTYADTLIQRTKISGLFYLGRDSRTGATALNGRINDFRIYSHCLSPIECKKISSALILHYSLSSGGGENLCVNSNNITTSNFVLARSTAEGNTITLTSTTSASYAKYKASNLLYSDYKNKTYTLSFYIRRVSGQNESYTDKQLNIYIGLNIPTRINNVISSSYDKYILLDSLVDIPSDWEYHSVTCTVPDDLKSGKDDAIADTSMVTFEFVNAASGTPIQIKSIKFEIGDKATPWVPNSTDDEYSVMGFDDNTEYDVSGYGNNGIRNNISWSSDSPRYGGCYEFNGIDSYIRINSGNWKVMGAEEFTVNEWAYADDWSAQTNAHLWSCTQSGGFNTENGGAGKLRFPIHVYTNAEKTTHDYINVSSDDSIIGTAQVGTATIANNVVGFVISDLAPGWHMFTGVYNTSGIKTYIDGVLKESANYTSYGVYYSNATLFLGAESASAVSCIAPYFNGKLSDFRMYYTALSDSDILALYNTPISLSNTGTLLTQGELSEV